MTSFKVTFNHVSTFDAFISDLFLSCWRFLDRVPSIHWMSFHQVVSCVFVAAYVGACVCVCVWFSRWFMGLVAVATCDPRSAAMRGKSSRCQPAPGNQRRANRYVDQRGFHNSVSRDGSAARGQNSEEQQKQRKKEKRRKKGGFLSTADRFGSRTA